MLWRINIIVNIKLTVQINPFTTNFPKITHKTPSGLKCFNFRQQCRRRKCYTTTLKCITPRTMKTFSKTASVRPFPANKTRGIEFNYIHHPSHIVTNCFTPRLDSFYKRKILIFTSNLNLFRRELSVQSNFITAAKA